MRARHICAIAGIAAAVGAVVFMQSLVKTNDAQSERVAERLLKEVPVSAEAQVARLAVDFRPDGRVMQGPPLMAAIATEPGVDGVAVTRALFAQRKLEVPPVGTELVFVGRRGTYRLKVSKILEWDRPLRGYPNAFVSPETAKAIAEEWSEHEPQSAAELAPGFMSDGGRNLDRSKALLLWAAALTALCLLLNSLFLSIEARRRDFAVLRMLGMTRSGVVGAVMRESVALTAAGFVLGAALAAVGIAGYVATDKALFPAGFAISFRSVAVCAVLAPLVALVASLMALKPALAVKPLEAASARMPRKRHLGMLVSFAFGFEAFVAVEVWGASLISAFVPSAEWPDAIVSILPGGVSSFDIEKLGKLDGVRKIAELQPLQVNLDPLEELPAPGGKKAKVKGEGEEGTRGRGPGARDMKAYRNALLLASDWLPEFRFLEGTRESAAKELLEGDACVISAMMARARKLKAGDELKLDCGRELKLSLKIVGVVELNWHMVTSRGLVRGLNRMSVNTDGPVFVSFDTLAACDARPQEFVGMTHLWLDYDPAFEAKHGVFEAGRLVEKEIVSALNGADLVTKEGEVRGNTVRLHARDEIADGTLAHGASLVGSMARVPFIFIAVLSLGFVAMIIASAESRKREFVVLRVVGATRGQLAWILAKEALRTALGGLAFGLVGGAAAGWLFTFVTRKAMANWGIPANFAIPWSDVAEGALGALVFSVLVAVPTALAVIRRATQR